MALPTGVVSQLTRGTEDGQRPKPGGGSGTLTVVDNRTGKKYELGISEGGTIRAADLKQIMAGGDGVGLRTYDPGQALVTTLLQIESRLIPVVLKFLWLQVR